MNCKVRTGIETTARRSRSRFASFVGLSALRGEELVASDRWRACLARSGSRTAEAIKQSLQPSLLLAYRGNDQGFFEGDRHTVVLDGYIDNLRALAISTFGPHALDSAHEAELVAALLARKGEAILAGFTGSFALAIFTRESGEVLLARDRFGDRPLFYGATPTGWAWASEIKSLCPLLDCVNLDPEGLRQAIDYRYVLGDTLIDGVSQVMPACHVRLAVGKSPVETQYWKLTFRPSPTSDTLDSWADRVDTGLDACLARLRDRHRDIGILLSGGVDSSLLAAKAACSGFRTCVALTAKWPGDNPELEAAAAVARHLGIEHQIVDIDESYIEKSFPWIVWRLEEPPRHYNSVVLARLFSAASGQFDTLISGHAADALFGPPGIIGLEIFRRRRSQLEYVPKGLRTRLAGLLGRANSHRFDHLKKCLAIDEHEYIQSYFEIQYGVLGDSLLRRQPGPSNPGRKSVNRFYEPMETAAERFQRYDLYTFNQTHTQVFDRLGAPHGIGVTSPFLAPEMVEIAETLPSTLKADGPTAKPVLKALAARYFPREWIYRPHQGFPTPTTNWLQGAFSSWRRQLSGNRLASRGLLNVSDLQAMDPDRNYETIWTAMTLEMFCRQFLDGEGSDSFMTG